jgi:hypothetical protein
VLAGNNQTGAADLKSKRDPSSRTALLWMTAKNGLSDDVSVFVSAHCSALFEFDSNI